MSAVEAIRFEHPGSIAEEDQARADFYALLANLFYRAPDERLLQAILIAPEPTAESDHVLVEAWAALAAASGVVTYNGKSFDWPLLRTRFVMNRLPVPEAPQHLVRLMLLLKAQSLSYGHSGVQLAATPGSFQDERGHAIGEQRSLWVVLAVELRGRGSPTVVSFLAPGRG